MSPSRFVAFTKQLIAAPPMSAPQEVVDSCATYWARRLMPTPADMEGFAMSERLQVDDWADVVGQDPALTKELRRSAMPVRYSDAKLQASAALKYELVVVPFCVDVSKLNTHSSGAEGLNSCVFVQSKASYDFF